jgi:hypothetical protein
MYAFSMYISHNKTNISINQIDFNLVIYVIRDSLTDLHKQGEIFSKTLQIIVIPLLSLKYSNNNISTRV